VRKSVEVVLSRSFLFSTPLPTLGFASEDFSTPPVISLQKLLEPHVISLSLVLISFPIVILTFVHSQVLLDDLSELLGASVDWMTRECCAHEEEKCTVIAKKSTRTLTRH
jgi:hypothetical protein